MEDAIPWRLRILVLAVCFEGGLAGLAWLIGWALGQPLLDHVHWTTRAFAQGAAAAGPLVMAFAGLVRCRQRAVLRIHKILDDVIRPMFGSSTLLDLAIISLM